MVNYASTWSERHRKISNPHRFRMEDQPRRQRSCLYVKWGRQSILFFIIWFPLRSRRRRQGDRRPALKDHQTYLSGAWVALTTPMMTLHAVAGEWARRRSRVQRNGHPWEKWAVPCQPDYDRYPTVSAPCPSPTSPQEAASQVGRAGQSQDDKQIAS